VEYFLHWINLSSAKKYSDEFCPNCGESEFLKAKEEYNISTLSINKMLNNHVKEIFLKEKEEKIY